MVVEIKSNMVNCRICLVARRVKKVGLNKNINWENSIDIYWYMVLDIQKKVIRVRKKQCNVSSCMNYLQFVFKCPENVRKTVFLLIF